MRQLFRFGRCVLFFTVLLSPVAGIAAPEPGPSGHAQTDPDHPTATTVPAAVESTPAVPATPAAPLVVIGLDVLEILPRDYEETRKFYTQVLPFREQEASGGAGARRCLLTAGPVRLRLRELSGKPVRPQPVAWLGVYPAPLSEMAAQAAGLKEAKGVLAEEIVPQGPAAAAGLLKGDILLAVEGKEVLTPEGLIGTVRGFGVGKKVLVTVWRALKKEDIPIELQPSPFPEQTAPVSLRLQVRDLESYYRDLLRRTVNIYSQPRETPAGRLLELIDPNGVLVVLEEPRQPAKE